MQALLDRTSPGSPWHHTMLTLGRQVGPSWAVRRPVSADAEDEAPQAVEPPDAEDEAPRTVEPPDVEATP